MNEHLGTFINDIKTSKNYDKFCMEILSKELIALIETFGFQ